MKTNAARFLDALHIPYELRAYTVDPTHVSAVDVAHEVGLPPEQVFKTLVTVSNTAEHLFAVVPGDAEIDFKKLAKAAHVRAVDMVPLKEVQPLTGYIRGGVTVFGAKKSFPVFLDETAQLFDFIAVSAGVRGLQMCLSPADYCTAAKATMADLSKDL